jgi:hypothetical protein
MITYIRDRQEEPWRHASDLNRNMVLESFGPYGLEGITQVAIDENWSTLRVRPVGEIKSMTRKQAFSEEGKKNQISLPETTSCHCLVRKPVIMNYSHRFSLTHLV